VSRKGSRGGGLGPGPLPVVDAASEAASQATVGTRH